jgi:hypothetical protein
MENELDLDLEPGAGLEKTAEIIGEVKPIEIVTEGLTDLQGNPFDPEMHKTHPDGTPRLGSKNQLLLKKEAKKSAAQWVKEKVSKVWNGEKETDDGNSDDWKIPLSDHELPPKNEEKPESGEEFKRKESTLLPGVSVNAQIGGEMVFMGYGAVMGSTVYEHRTEFFPRVCQILHEEELRTGHAVPIPAWMITPLALVQVGVEIASKDERCKKAALSKMDVLKKTIVKNSVKSSILSKFRRGPKDEGGAE